MRRPRKRSRNRLALAKGLAWLLVPVLPGAAVPRATPVSMQVPMQVIAPCTAEEVALAHRLEVLDALVAESGTGACVRGDGLVMRFVPRAGLRAEIAAWILEMGANHPSLEWRLTRNRQDDVVLALQCSTSKLAFVCAHAPSTARLPRI